MLEPNKIYERLTQEGEAWADKHAAAEILDGTLKQVLSKCVIEYREGGCPVGESEHRAHIDPRYIEARTLTAAARQEANRAKVRYKAAEAWFDALRTAEATHRAAAKAAPG